MVTETVADRVFRGRLPRGGGVVEDCRLRVNTVGRDCRHAKYREDLLKFRSCSVLRTFVGRDFIPEMAGLLRMSWGVLIKFRRLTALFRKAAV